MIPLFGEYNFICENCMKRIEIQINPETGDIRVWSCNCKLEKVNQGIDKAN